MLIVLPFSIDVGLKALVKDAESVKIKALVKNAESVKMKALVKGAHHPCQSISEEC